MELNLIQQDIQRSIFEAIRKVLVEVGYLPDVTLYAQDATGQAQWDIDLKAIASGAKKFAIEVFGPSSPQSKGAKKVPRITIHSGRVIPGDIGLDVYQGTIKNDPENPNTWVREKGPFETSNMQFDIHLVSATAEQDVVLNAVLYNALGERKFIPLHNDPNQLFYIRKYDYYDTMDAPEGITEKVSSYEVEDLILSEQTKVDVVLIKEIDVDVKPENSEITNLHIEDPLNP